MFIMNTDEHEIKQIARDLLSTKYPSYDDISAKVVKATIDLIFSVLCDILNK